MLDLLSSLKGRKTKTLKLCGQSETTKAGRQSRRAAGQRVREPSPLEKPGGTVLLHLD